jgi:hypothetical protein
MAEEKSVVHRRKNVDNGIAHCHDIERPRHVILRLDFLHTGLKEARPLRKTVAKTPKPRYDLTCSGAVRRSLIMKNRMLFIGLAIFLAACAEAPRSAEPFTAKDEPQGLTQLSATQLTATYGTPSFTRQENGDEIWRYDVGACRVFFFLYHENGGLSVRHVESIPRGKKLSVDQNCLNALDVRAKKA